jgi:hypothetical protein
MKRLFTLLAFLSLITLNGCKKDKDDLAYSGDYSRSYLAWHDFQTKTGDSYVYQMETGSWTGYRVETTITVKQGKIIERAYVLTEHQLISSGPTTVVREWKEDETQLGTHNEGHDLLTLDDIYEKAKNDWLLKRDDTKTYFETDNDGMISECGYTKDGCQDDCFNGVHIPFIRAL